MARRALTLIAFVALIGIIPAQAITTQIRTVVLLVNFTNDATQPYGQPQVDATMPQVASFLADSSYGQASITWETRGWFTINDQNTDCDYVSWQTQARAAAGDLTGFTHIIYAFSHLPNCPWLGIGGGTLTSGMVVVYGSFQYDRVRHEFAHAIGLNHAGLTDAPTQPPSGTDSGDPYTFWSNSSMSLNGAERAYLGWLTPTVITASGTYALPTVENAGLLRIIRPDNTRLDIDYRAELAGITIRHGVAPGNGSRIWLIKSNPSCGFGYVLDLGRSWYDAYARVLVKVTGLNPAQVQVTLNADPPVVTPDTTPPSVPTGLSGQKQGKNVNLSWSPSTDDQDCSPSYHVFRNGVQIGTTGSTIFTDPNVPRRSTLTYRVSAFDDAGNESAQSIAVTVQT